MKVLTTNTHTQGPEDIGQLIDYPSLLLAITIPTSLVGLGCRSMSIEESRRVRSKGEQKGEARRTGRLVTSFNEQWMPGQRLEIVHGFYRYLLAHTCQRAMRQVGMIVRDDDTIW